MAISDFRGEFNFLSNFYGASIKVGNLSFSNVEAAFQAFKTFNADDTRLFQNMNASTAKKQGRKVLMRDDWQEARLGVMFYMCMLKFTQHPDLREKLLNTGMQYLIEGNTWRDTFWGVYKGKGENMLGKILMFVRLCVRHENCLCAGVSGNSLRIQYWPSGNQQQFKLDREYCRIVSSCESTAQGLRFTCFDKESFTVDGVECDGNFVYVPHKFLLFDTDKYSVLNEEVST